MFGKLMSVPDPLMDRYFLLCTNVDMDEVKKEMHPRDKKRWLGREIVKIYHGAEAAQAADDAFVRQFSQREVPLEMEEKTVSSPINVVDLVVAVGFAGSKRDARRLVDQGAVQLDGTRATASEVTLQDGAVLKVSRRYVRLRLG
jgi:tyrosyl-tRNA synthetase